MPTASISSMKTMHWPPHLRASRLAFRARKRTMITSMPMNVCAKPEPGMVTIGELKPVAIALASIVFPVPGAPRKSSPRSLLPPAFSNASPDCQRPTTRLTSSLASAWPRTSSSFTPQSASPGSKPRIWEMPIASIGPSRITKLKMKKMTSVTTSESDPGTRAIPALIVCEASPTVPKKLVSSRPYLIIRTKYTARIASTIRYSDLEPEVPEPHAPARDDVLFAQRRAVDPEQVRPLDEAVEEQVEEAAEGGDGEEREQQRPADRPALDLVRPDEDRRRGENCNPGRGSAQRCATARSARADRPRRAALL